MTLLYSQGATLKMQHLSNWGRTEWIIPLTTLIFLYTGKNEPHLDTRRCDEKEMQKHVNRHPALTFRDPGSLSEDAAQVGAGQWVILLLSGLG